MGFVVFNFALARHGESQAHDIAWFNFYSRVRRGIFCVYVRVASLHLVYWHDILGSVNNWRLVLASVQNLWDYWKNRKVDGVVCEVSQNKKTQTTFEKLRTLFIARAMVVYFGHCFAWFSVNLVELACSAGFPAIYTGFGAQWHANVAKVSLCWAIFFYMLDDLIVFIIAVVTLKSRIVGSKFAISNLIGGVLILILGILLIFKPEWLMFHNYGYTDNPDLRIFNVSLHLSKKLADQRFNVLLVLTNV